MKDDSCAGPDAAAAAVADTEAGFALAELVWDLWKEEGEKDEGMVDKANE